nr:PDDEXK nuclease domain-containing protein [Bacteroides sp. K03]
MFLYLKKAQERDIEKQLVSHITQILLELGKGFAFVRERYSLKI